MKYDRKSFSSPTLAMTTGRGVVIAPAIFPIHVIMGKGVTTPGSWPARANDTRRRVGFRSDVTAPVSNQSGLPQPIHDAVLDAPLAGRGMVPQVMTDRRRRELNYPSTEKQT